MLHSCRYNQFSSQVVVVEIEILSSSSDTEWHDILLPSVINHEEDVGKTN